MTFLGFAEYLRRFVSGYAKVTASVAFSASKTCEARKARRRRS
jgi:hypothetical protein